MPQVRSLSPALSALSVAAPSVAVMGECLGCGANLVRRSQKLYCSVACQRALDRRRRIALWLETGVARGLPPGPLRALAHRAGAGWPMRAVWLPCAVERSASRPCARPHRRRRDEQPARESAADLSQL